MAACSGSSCPPARRPRLARLATLLYAEDNPANLELVAPIVRFRADLQLLSAPNADLGIGLARARLPGISGAEAQQMLGADPGTAHIPVIALIANAMARDIQTALDAGFFRYLTKPIKIDAFTEAIDSALAVAAERLAAMAATKAVIEPAQESAGGQ